MRTIVLGLLAAAMSAGAVSGATDHRRVSPHAHMSHHEMLYGQHNHHYHHLYRSEHHHATATGGPAGGLPHRN